jgi:hypothetical protein
MIYFDGGSKDNLNLKLRLFTLDTGITDWDIELVEMQILHRIGLRSTAVFEKQF